MEAHQDRLKGSPTVARWVAVILCDVTDACLIIALLKMLMTMNMHCGYRDLPIAMSERLVRLVQA